MNQSPALQCITRLESHTFPPRANALATQVSTSWHKLIVARIFLN